MKPSCTKTEGVSAVSADLEPWTLTDLWQTIWQAISHSKWVRRWCLPWLLHLDERFEPRLLGHRMTRVEIGLTGEILATRWLRRHRRKILYRNYRGHHRGEVDIVARHGNVLTFIEVKTRTSRVFGRPADAVNREKERLIQRGAQDWLRLLGKPRLSFRFDILEVLLVPGEVPRLTVLENAFGLPDSAMSGR